MTFKLGLKAAAEKAASERVGRCGVADVVAGSREAVEPSFVSIEIGAFMVRRASDLQDLLDAV